MSVSSITAENVARHDDPRSVDLYSREAGLWPIEEQLIGDFVPPPPASILDLGCGAGRTTQALSAAGWKTVALDLSAPLLDVARRRGPRLALVQADAAALSFRSGRFDAVLFSFNGLDYIYPESERVRCLTEVLRVLKPGGVFIFSTHNLIGTMFSGGYLYLRGHVNALKLLAAQLGNPHRGEWYLRYGEFAGPQHHFSAPPGRTVEQLRRAGFVLETIRGASGERRRRAVLMHQAHVYFVARKPQVTPPWQG
jgi:SAM-dependent methyltransferase